MGTVGVLQFPFSVVTRMSTHGYICGFVVCIGTWAGLYVRAVNLKCFFNKIKIVTCKPSGNAPRDGRLPGKHIMIRVVNCIVLQLEPQSSNSTRRYFTPMGVVRKVRPKGDTGPGITRQGGCCSSIPLLEVDCNQITQATCFAATALGTYRATWVVIVSGV